MRSFRESSLTGREQTDLLCRYRELGDEEARDKLLHSLTGIIMKEALYWSMIGGIRQNAADLAQEGWMAALRATETLTFDSGAGVKFGTYVTEAVRNSMKLFLRRYAKAVALTSTGVRKARAAAANGQGASKPPSLDIVSLSDPVPGSADGEKPRVWEDVLPSSHGSVVHIEEYRARAAFIRTVREQLAPRVAAVVIPYFGIDGRGRRSLMDIAKQRGVKRQAVHQVLKRAYRRMPRLAELAAVREKVR